VDEFRCSNNELCSALSISEKSLWGYRNELIQAGLISYKSGKSKKSIGIYSFNGCKIYNQSDNQTGNQSDNQSVNQSGGFASDYIEDKPKLKTQTETSFSAADASAPRGQSTKRQKASSKKNTPAPAAKFWAPMVELWFTFNEEKYGARPTFHGADPRHFKKILDILEQRALNAGLQWTEGVAHERLGAFLDIAFQDPWMQQNFLLPHLDKFMDKFILNQQHGNSKISGKAAGRAKTGRGGTIEDLQALKRRPKGPADAGTGPGGLPDHPGGTDWVPAEVIE